MEDVRFEFKDGQLYEFVAQPVSEEPSPEAVNAAQAVFDQANGEVEQQEQVLSGLQASVDEAEGVMRQKVEAKADAESALLKSQARLEAAAAARELASQQPQPEQPADTSEDTGNGQANGDIPVQVAEGAEQPA